MSARAPVLPYVMSSGTERLGVVIAAQALLPSLGGRGSDDG
ncbi:MAG: hypothetical protein SOY67_05885 [Collinsella sp.]|nr:hypothetical protein [Collinsella sp.]